MTFYDFCQTYYHWLYIRYSNYTYLSEKKKKGYMISTYNSRKININCFVIFYIKQWWECELKLILLVLLSYSQRVRLVMHYLFFFSLIIYTYISKMIILWLNKCDSLFFLSFFLVHLKEKEVNYISNPILTFLSILISFENNFLWKSLLDWSFL